MSPLGKGFRPVTKRPTTSSRTPSQLPLKLTLTNRNPPPDNRDPRDYTRGTNESGVRVAEGVDTLVLTFDALLPDAVYRELWAIASRSKERTPNLLGTFAIGSEVFELSRAGRGYPFKLSRAGLLDLAVASKNHPGFPSVRAELRSPFLWEEGAVEAASQTVQIVETLATTDPRTGKPLDPAAPVVERVERIDIAVDVQGLDLTGSDEEAERFICKAEPVRHGAGARFTGYTFGRSSPILVRIYNKTKEVNTSGRQWIQAKWREVDGYDPNKNVWRVEAQLRAEGLRQFQALGNSSTVFDRCDEIWRHIVGKPGEHGWITLTEPSRDSNRSRWPVAAWWRVVQEAVFFHHNAAPAVRWFRHAGDRERLRAQVAGSLAKWTVLSSVETVSDPLGQALEAFREAQREHDRHATPTFAEIVSGKRTLGYLHPVPQPTPSKNKGSTTNDRGGNRFGRLRQPGGRKGGTKRNRS